MEADIEFMTLRLKVKLQLSRRSSSPISGGCRKAPVCWSSDNTPHIPPLAVTQYCMQRGYAVESIIVSSYWSP